MPSKRIIAVLAVLLGALAAVSASAGAATLCPPGVTDATYCAVGNASGLVLQTHYARTSNDGFVDVTVPCAASPKCSGKLFLESSGGKNYGSVTFSIKRGRHITLHVRLTAAARTALSKTGKRPVRVIAVSKRVRSVLGYLTIKGPKKH